MKTLATLLLLLLPLGCAQSHAPNTPAPTLPALPPLDADCDWQTPLVPGVPGSPGNLIRSARNPNGDSELSYVMRHMADGLEAARAAAQRGERPAPLLGVHRRIRCSWPSKPEERNAQFDGMARAYLAAVEAFDNGPTQARYNAMVQGCISCHSMTCRGPIDMIEDLAWR